MIVKLSEYSGEYVMLDGEVEPRETLLELLEEGELDEGLDVFTVEEKPVWGHIIDAHRVWMMFTDYMYDELSSCFAEAFEGSEDIAKTEFVSSLNAWADKHVDGTVLVGTRTRIDISELFERVKP